MRALGSGSRNQQPHATQIDQGLRGELLDEVFNGGTVGDGDIVVGKTQVTGQAFVDQGTGDLPEIVLAIEQLHQGHLQVVEVDGLMPDIGDLALGQ